MPAHEEFRMFPKDKTRLRTANADLAERIDREGLFLLYDDILDTLLVSVGSHRDGFLEPLADNIYARIDPETLVILGYEITDFHADFLPNNRLVAALVDDLHLAQRPNQWIDASRTAQKETLRRLVAAA